MTYRKKLIEVALPLEAINQGAKPETENPFLKGHPRAVHNWWARTPLSVARAILFAQLIDDPGNDLPPKDARAKREELLQLVARIATWEATTDYELIDKARKLIRQQFNGNMPEFWDMFGGRASIPLEAQRLGLKVTSSDLNPVAVTIQRALLEYPQKFSGKPPVHPTDDNLLTQGNWRGAQGLAEDIRWYGRWVCQKAKQQLANLYPHGPGGEAVFAWIWARTIPSPDPSTKGAAVPLVRSMKLAGKKHPVWVHLKVDRENNSYSFSIDTTEPTIKTTVSGKNKGATCILSGANIPFAHIRESARNGQMGIRLMAFVCQGNRARHYYAPTEEQEQIALSAQPEWRPDCELPKKHRNFQPPVYGMDNVGDLFTNRQLVAFNTFARIINEDVKKAVLARTDNDVEYTDALVTYLACALSRMADYHCNLCTWNPTNENVSHLFQRQAIPMAWDFCEANPIEGKLSYEVATEWVASSLTNLPENRIPARVRQLDACRAELDFEQGAVISTDPPYYDNISYAELGDFFYCWLRKVLRSVDPQTFATLNTPKAPELIASPTRHGSVEKAEEHFRSGFQAVFRNLLAVSRDDVPCTIYYAFKQEETDKSTDNRASTGWETMLTGLIEAGFQITGTWPVRTTKKARSVAKDANALASAIVLVTRKRRVDASLATRKEFIAALRRELPQAVAGLTQSNIAPVDLAQASIGPGISVFSRYAHVLEADGSYMTVRAALELINRVLDEVFAEQEGEFDADTRWALAWFEQYGMDEGEFGEAETLSRAKNTAVNGLVDAGLITARSGKVRLIPRDQMPKDWDPATESRLTVWEATQHLIRALDQDGESGAARLLRKLGGLGETARDLAYRLFSICERKGWSGEALAYNSLVIAWPEISRLAMSQEVGKERLRNKELF
ncbi:Adenine-specific DNA methylase containing a Zn-ribbon [Dissulfuribacter thermophilus]|uniref:Adenine-specific DNA methylase containing a Zn-ribbon n=1 Tax=Dissulfuribacter thermophilus TaxID=1156395 RepID=A0A1B9F4B5_9BACT|nr:DUF1156 domain-containing protein [Dissulfuribacter thermophilus]OCC14778.1 Adenine-specific DNA methylase containing a Zn-ribbon [Dissulfuribacter thermophilus]